MAHDETYISCSTVLLGNERETVRGTQTSDGIA